MGSYPGVRDWGSGGGSGLLHRLGHHLRSESLSCQVAEPVRVTQDQAETLLLHSEGS